MSVEFLNRGIWQRLFGIPATKEPKNKNSWTYHSGELIVHLDCSPELKEPGSAVRFEGGVLPVRVLVVFDEDEQFHAFHNRCTHFGHRRLDYVRGTDTIQCCSINKSTYTFAGKKIHGPNPKPVDTYPVKKDGDNLYIKLS
ncbi:MAG: Rieske 2Fe-2S domain-containing protein [Proteobacteria bacterium]|nr:Rieske 2Fe-2S domain-containing protein [Pseudomonadota bacterium]